MDKVLKVLEKEISKTKESILKWGNTEASLRERNHHGEDLFDDWIHANEMIKKELLNLKDLEKVKDLIDKIDTKKTSKRGRPKKA